jgi:hypothetical protein
MHPLVQFQYPLDSTTSLFPIALQTCRYRERESGVQQSFSGLPVSKCIYDRLEEIGLVKREVPRSLQRRAARVNPPLEARSEGPK